MTYQDNFKDIKHICIIADNYPTDSDPVFSFVAQLAEAVVNYGVDVTVIAPQNFMRYVLGGRRRHPKNRVQHYGDNVLSILQPCCLSFSNHTPRINFASRRRAIEKSFESLKGRPDVCYGHFWHSGYYIYRKSKKYNIPLFVATGESEIHFRADTESKREFCDYVKGVICVSTKNKEESLEKNLTFEEKCIVIPNAIDNQIFRPLDKRECRAALDIKNDDFVVAFVGWFNERKGSLRVSHAIDKLNNDKIKSIFIGSGTVDFEPRCNNIVFKGRVPHSDIPRYLNAADVFVLPTLKEGCCNALIEAMACGLPIVSSDRSFNYDVLNDSNAILVDPENELAIAQAIEQLIEDKALLDTLAMGAVRKAQSLTIGNRAQKLLAFIQSKVNQESSL